MTATVAQVSSEASALPILAPTHAVLSHRSSSLSSAENVSIRAAKEQHRPYSSAGIVMEAQTGDFLLI